MSLADLETEIRSYLSVGPVSPLLAGSLGTGAEANRLYVIKYVSPKYLADIQATSSLYASDAPARTWGDAIYVAPISWPLTTMMYGVAGVVGWLDAASMVFYDAINPAGISYYQQWITFFPSLYTQLTTTVHANEANRELRMLFRTRFGIDCVFFRPDEPCAGYSDSETDVWLAVTQWDAGGHIVSGRSQRVRDLRWCAIGTEAFEAHGLGYQALLHPALSTGKTFQTSTYANLGAKIRKAYAAKTTVVITEF